jgi:hypothetical protein
MRWPTTVHMHMMDMDTAMILLHFSPHLYAFFFYICSIL